MQKESVNYKYSFEELVKHANTSSIINFIKEKRNQERDIQIQNHSVINSKSIKSKFNQTQQMRLTNKIDQTSQKYRPFPNKMRATLKRIAEMGQKQTKKEDLIKAKIKEKLFQSIQKEINYVTYYEGKTYNTFFDQQTKLRLQQLVTTNLGQYQRQILNVYQDDLKITSNICTILEHNRDKRKNFEYIHNENSTTFKDIFRSRHEKQLQQETKHRLLNFKKLQTQTKKPKHIEQIASLSARHQTQDTIVFLKQQEIQQIYLKRNVFESLPILDEIRGQAFTILHKKNNKHQILFDLNPQVQMEIASLTKTMTCLLILLLTDKFNINRKTTLIKINQKASRLQGTSAHLLYSDILTIENLLYGLMLPSGNDAAVALGEWGGKIIRMECNKNLLTPTSPLIRLKNSKSTGDIMPKKRSHLSLFIYHMNKIAKALNLTNTKFANVHGLMNKLNYSCCHDMMKLCLYAMKRQDFKMIVNTKQYKCLIKNKRITNERQETWINTNKLLNITGFCGVKTGITPSAGPCLASTFKITNEEHIYIVLLKTKTINKRFQESKKLLIEIIKQLYSKTNKKKYLNSLQILDENLNLDIPSQEEDQNNFEVSEDEQDVIHDE